MSEGGDQILEPLVRRRDPGEDNQRHVLGHPDPLSRLRAWEPVWGETGAIDTLPNHRAPKPPLQRSSRDRHKVGPGDSSLE